MVVNRQQEIEKMFGYLTKEHQRNIHKDAFKDIANVFFDFYEEYVNQLDQYFDNKNGEREGKPDPAVNWVCNASMGHGKTTVLNCFLKWLVSENRPKQRVPILLAIRENGMADEIFKEMKAFDKNCIVVVDKDNKENIEEYVPYHQIVIITHARMDNLALNYGNRNLYSTWHQYNRWAFSSKEKLDPKNRINKRRRMLITDEKPSFRNSSIFDIGSKNNGLEWFDNLSRVLKLIPYDAQGHRSQIINLIADHLHENLSSCTTALLTDEKYKDNVRVDNLKQLILNISSADESKANIDSVKKLKHFVRLLNEDNVGRIDNYDDRGLTGRKIIVSDRIDYKKLKMNMLVLDGTAVLNKQQYVGFELKEVTNYNDYSRLFITQDRINTSKYSRGKEKSTTQKAIHDRIMELYQQHEKLFVLPMKSDIPIYKSMGSIHSDYMNAFEIDINENTKPINQLNTTGKNILKEITDLYLTSVPKMNADHYKAVAISLYGDEVDLNMNEDENSICWFKDMKLELIYRGELYAEILQIIHRTALRKIKEQIPIHIYMAFDDSKGDQLLCDVQPLIMELNDWYFKNCKYKWHQLHDDSLYGLGDKVHAFADEISKWISKNITFFNNLPQPLSKIDEGKGGIGEKFRTWLKKHWGDKHESINKKFAEYGYIIFEKKDNNSERTKYIATIKQHSHDSIWEDIG